MGAMFLVIPVIFMGVALYMIGRRIVRLRRLLGIWRQGEQAEGRCLRTYETHRRSDNGSTSTTIHHVFEFTTRSGQQVRFEESGGSARVVQGDFVTVTYLPLTPERATAKPRKEGKEYAAAAAEIAFFVVFFSFSLFFLKTSLSFGF